MNPLIYEPIVRLALAEDLGQAGDVTSDLLLDAGLTIEAQLVARQNGVLAGLGPALLTCRLVDPDLRVETRKSDGDALQPGDVIAVWRGSARSILTAERTALNFLGRLSGIASLTARYVGAVADTQARILCTRKTTPGLRALEKQAVRLGGGVNHRFNLADAILIKDNHIAASGSATLALKRAQARVGHLCMIEIEVDNLTQLAEILPLAPQAVLLDNFSLGDLDQAVTMIRASPLAKSCKIEASGGVSLQTVGAIARTGVDFISVGALTHSAPNFDLGLDM